MQDGWSMTLAVTLPPYMLHLSEMLLGGRHRRSLYEKSTQTGKSLGAHAVEIKPDSYFIPRTQHITPAPFCQNWAGGRLRAPAGRLGGGRQRLRTLSVRPRQGSHLSLWLATGAPLRYCPTFASSPPGLGRSAASAVPPRDPPWPRTAWSGSVRSPPRRRRPTPGRSRRPAVPIPP